MSSSLCYEQQEKSKFNLFINKSTGWVYRSRESQIQNWWQSYVRKKNTRTHKLIRFDRAVAIQLRITIDQIVCVRKFHLKNGLFFFFCISTRFWIHNKWFEEAGKKMWSSASSCHPLGRFCNGFPFTNDNEILNYCRPLNWRQFLYLI